MPDQSPQQPPQKAPEQQTSWIVRQAGGTAIAATVGAAVGGARSLYKKTPLPGGIKGGALVGVVASLGFGGMLYDAVFKPKPTFQEKLTDERAQPTGAEVQR